MISRCTLLPQLMDFLFKEQVPPSPFTAIHKKEKAT